MREGARDVQIQRSNTPLNAFLNNTAVSRKAASGSVYESVPKLPVKGKVKQSLCLIKHHAMKTYEGAEV
jgi:hypothetical protein